MDGVTLLWVLGGLLLLTCLVFVALFLRFLTKALVSYVKQRPYAALAIFASTAAPTSFACTYFGLDLLAGALIAIFVGITSLTFVAMELGSD